MIVFGSVNVDLVARVERLPVAGETLNGRAFSMTAGGKGANQALAARRAGAQVALFGAVGRDPFAATALALLRTDGVDVARVRAVAAPTGVALIHVDANGENAITVVAGANAFAKADQVPDDALLPATIVVMQLETPLVEVEALARRARARRARVIVNAAPAMPLSTDFLKHVDVLVVNERESAAIAQSLGIDPTPDVFVADYRDRYGADAIVSLGSRGLVASSPEGRVAVAAPRIDVVDTVGAGDALVGACAAALDRGAPWTRALAEGVAAGSLACTRAGAQSSLPDRHAIATLADTI